MSKKGVLVIVLWSCIAFALLAVLILGIVRGLDLNWLGTFFGEGELHEVYSDSMNADEFDSLKISWESGNVQVRPSDDGQVHITQRSYYKVHAMECDVSGNYLTVEEYHDFGFFFFGFGPRSSDLELDLPSKQYKDFTLKMTSGNTTMNEVTASNMNFELTSGKLEATALQAEKIKAHITSGQIDVDESKADNLTVDETSGTTSFKGSFDAISGKTTSGTCRIETDVAPKALNADLTSGKVSVTIPDNDGFILDCKKTSGDIKSNFDLMKSISDENSKYTYQSGGKSGREYSVKLTSGTFELNKAK